MTSGDECPLYAFFGKERLLVFAHEYEAGSVQNRHRHDVPQLLHAARGVMRMTTPTGYWVVPPGRGVWIPAFMPHEIRMVGPVSMCTLYVGGEWGRDLASHCAVIDVPPLLADVLKALSDQRCADDRPRLTTLEDLALIELGRADRLSLHVPMPSDDRVRRLCERALSDPSDTRTLDELADEAGASGRTMRRLFQSELGMSFAAWRQQARLVEALARLSEDRSVSEIARELGYASPSAFTAMFKQATGKSPRDFVRLSASRVS